MSSLTIELRIDSESLVEALLYAGRKLNLGLYFDPKTANEGVVVFDLDMFMDKPPKGWKAWFWQPRPSGFAIVNSVRFFPHPEDLTPYNFKLINGLISRLTFPHSPHSQLSLSFPAEEKSKEQLLQLLDRIGYSNWSEMFGEKNFDIQAIVLTDLTINHFWQIFGVYSVDKVIFFYPRSAKIQ